jgi:hypothetical protein
MSRWPRWMDRNKRSRGRLFWVEVVYISFAPGWGGAGRFWYSCPKLLHRSFIGGILYFNVKLVIVKQGFGQRLYRRILWLLMIIMICNALCSNPGGHEKRLVLGSVQVCPGLFRSVQG